MLSVLGNLIDALKIVSVYSVWWEIARPFKAFSGIPSLLTAVNLALLFSIVLVRCVSRHGVMVTVTSPSLDSLSTSELSGLSSAGMCQPSFFSLVSAMRTGSVLGKSELPIGAVSVFIFGRAVKRLHGAFLQPGRLHDVGLDSAAVKVKTHLQVVLTMRELGLERKHNRELGTLNDLHVRQGSLRVLTVGLMFVKSIAIDADFHARLRDTCDMHCSGDAVVVLEPES